MADETEIKNAFADHLANRSFPCVAAKAAQAKQQLSLLVAGHMLCPMDDARILDFLYSFVDTYRASNDFYHSAAILFKEPQGCTEEMFEDAMWKRLQSIADLDAQHHRYDNRVSHDPSSAQFSFSIREEAFYIIGMHPLNNRESRRFAYPTLVFNPHHQFEELRKTQKYEQIKKVIRKRDMAVSGSVNPMLEDFGKASEALQYSGRVYDETWQCPLKIKHATS